MLYEAAVVWRSCTYSLITLLCGAFLRLGSARQVEPAGHEVGDDVPHEEAANLCDGGPATLLAGPLHGRLPAGVPA